MCDQDKRGIRRIEDIIAELNLPNRSDREQVMRSIMAVVVDIEMLERCLGDAEAGSPLWFKLQRRLIDELREDAGKCALEFQLNPGDVLNVAWRCYVQSANKYGWERSLYVEATVLTLADRLRCA